MGLDFKNRSAGQTEDFGSIELEIENIKADIQSLIREVRHELAKTAKDTTNDINGLTGLVGDNLDDLSGSISYFTDQSEQACAKLFNSRSHYIERDKQQQLKSIWDIEKEAIKSENTRQKYATKNLQNIVSSLHAAGSSISDEVNPTNILVEKTQTMLDNLENSYAESLETLRASEYRADKNATVKVAMHDENGDIAHTVKSKTINTYENSVNPAERIILETGQYLKDLGNGTAEVLSASGEAILKNGKKLTVNIASQATETIETVEILYEEVSATKALAMGSITNIEKTNNELQTRIEDWTQIHGEIDSDAGLRMEYEHAINQQKILTQQLALNNAKDAAREAELLTSNKEYQNLVLQTQTVNAETAIHKLALESMITDLAMQDTAYQNLLVQQKIAEKGIAETKAANEAWLQELANQHITDTNSKDAQRIKNYMEYNKQLEASNKFVDTAVSKIPLIGVKFGEVGPTIQEQFQNIKNIFKGASKDLAGKYYDKYTSKADYNKAMEEAGVNTKDKTAVKNYKQEVNEKLKEAKKGGKWEAYIQAKAEAEKNPEDADVAAKLKKAFDDTGMSENQAKAAEAQEKQKQSTVNGWANATAILANIAQKLDAMVDEIALNQAKVDTRLYGSKQNDKYFGSYWKQISFDLSATMLSPVLKEETLVNNVLKAVDMGIARDVQQFGMLETIKDKIATTFDTFDGTMLRLIKIQDNNTTAARLGMEASLNELLNQMYETTEYLTSLAATVRSNLEEAEALMEGEDAVDFEYQVQKWLGSLSSVGMSQSGVTAISDALGKLAAGDIEGITNGGVGNLLVMAANNANLSIADILADGLDSSETNVLLNQMVGYMNELVDEANGNLVVQQQLAKVFGLTASDLKAATNMTGTYLGNSNIMKTIYNKGTGDTYNAMLGTLGDMANSMLDRTSLGEMLTNIWSNVQYSTAAGEASNPVLYLTNKVADILDTFAAGIPIPAITAFGTGVDTKLTVSNIMKTAAMVGGFTQSLVSMIGSMASNGGSGVGTGLLKLVGIKTKVSRGASTSSSGTATVYNASVDDMTDSATAEGEDSANQQTVEAQEESTEVSNKTMNESILSIYDLLKDVIDGRNSLNVKVTNTPIEVSNGSSWTWPATSSTGTAAFNTGF